jgi:hypothetical protein
VEEVPEYLQLLEPEPVEVEVVDILNLPIFL